MYIPLNHDQMYTMLEGLDEELIGFFRLGSLVARPGVYHLSGIPLKVRLMSKAFCLNSRCYWSMS
jgi:hypothetical protein